MSGELRISSNLALKRSGPLDRAWAMRKFLLPFITSLMGFPTTSSSPKTPRISSCIWKAMPTRRP